MLASVLDVFRFMTKAEAVKWLTLTTVRSLLSILDLIGVLVIGLVAASAAYYLEFGSNPDRVVEFAGIKLASINSSNLTVALALVIVVFLLKSFLSIMIYRSSSFQVAKIEARSAKVISELTLGSNLEAYRRYSREQLVFAIQTSSPAAFNGVLNSFGILISEGTLFLILTMGFLIVNPGVAIGVFVYFTVIGSVIHFFAGKRVTKSSTDFAKETVSHNIVINDLIEAYRELSVLGRRDKFINSIYQKRLEAARSSANSIFLSGMPRYIIEAALMVGVGLLGLFLALSGSLVDAATTLGVFLAGGFRLTGALIPLQSALLVMQSMTPRAEVALEILRGPKTKTVKRDSPISGKIDLGPLGVELKDTDYAYPGSPSRATDGVSLKANPGEIVALFGPSGAGKSTLADLIAGLISPQKGLISYCSQTGHLSHQEIIGRIAYVPQKPGLISGRISENIALAVEPEEIDESLIWDSLKLAHLDHVIRSLPEGLDTKLGTMKDSLSGGELQRLGLARALYSKPGLLVLDEATSALDSESGNEIMESLQALRGKVTVVLIAHQTKMMSIADRIYVVKNGKIVDQGDFEYLRLKLR